MRKRPSRLLRARMALAVLRENLRKSGNARRLQDHRRRLRGELPAPGGPGVVFAACDDAYYARFATDFLFSAEDTGYAHRIHLHLYDPSARTLAHIGALRRGLRHTQLTYSWEDNRYERYGIDNVIYFAAARFIMIHHLLQECRSPILGVDIDGFIHRPLDGAFDLIGEADVTFHFRFGERRVWRRILAAAVGFNHTPEGLRFCERAARSILASLRLHPDFHTDQTILYHAYRFARRWLPAIRWQHLPLSLVDYDFQDDSFIWTAKGPRKEDASFMRVIGELQSKHAPEYGALPRLGPAESQAAP
ncbi:hypothetical protein E9232_003448 [Inquilinus ginsengisoli]|uniref:Glycosyl transferase n=1 Tax=Inquilinus ginsengisoli TaxID=363840 RepID=A0ABU1JRH8_9PROT|nr:hypothetical protein [Inquilinus ginsengisoli]MDR6290922.1 hypothetical protein [Inquilinus ginsengisoli]